MIKYPVEILTIKKSLERAIRNKIISFSKTHIDGRINSTIDEDLVINYLQKEFPNNIFKAKSRCWYDFCYKSKDKFIPVNVKISTGGTDNAFNKTAIVYSLTDLEDIPNNISFDKMHNLITDNLKNMRNKNADKEYFYLYIDKLDDSVILKSLLDIQNYVSNPSNILQINWKCEKKEKYNTNRDISECKDKLFNVIGESLNKKFKSCSMWLNFQ